MFGDDPKKQASAIVKKMIPPKDTSGDPHPEESDEPVHDEAGMHAAAEDAIAAMKSGDSMALHEALKAHHSIYDSMYDGEEDEDSDD